MYTYTFCLNECEKLCTKKFTPLHYTRVNNDELLAFDENGIYHINSKTGEHAKIDNENWGNICGTTIINVINLELVGEQFV